MPAGKALEGILDKQKCLQKLDRPLDFHKWRLEVLFVAELVKAEHRGDPQSYEPHSGVFIETHLCKMKLLMLNALSPEIRDMTLDLMHFDDQIEKKVVKSNDKGLFYMIHTIGEACVRVAKERRS